MKRFFQFALVAFAAVAVAACNPDNPNNGGNNNGGGKENNSSFKVDGDFSEWTAAGIATATVEGCEENGYPSLLLMKAGADKNNLYLYFEYELVEGQTKSAIDILINADNDPSTGFTSWIWSKEGCGWEYMLESEGGFLDGATAIRDMNEDMNVYVFKEGNGQDAWDAGSVFDQANAEDFFTNKGKVEGGIAYFECSIQRSVINANKAGKLSFGVTFTNVLADTGDWVTAGILPQSEDGIGQADMLEVTLP